MLPLVPPVQQNPIASSSVENTAPVYSVPRLPSLFDSFLPPLHPPGPVTTSIGLDNSWTGFEFGVCSDPDQIRMKLKYQIQQNKQGKSASAEVKPIRTAREVAEEKFRKQKVEEAAALEMKSRRVLPSWCFNRSDDNDNQNTIDLTDTRQLTKSKTTNTKNYLQDIDYEEMEKECDEIPGSLTPCEEKIINQDPLFVDPATVRILRDPHWKRFTTDIFVDNVSSPAEFVIHKQASRNALQKLEDALFQYYQPYWKVSRILTQEELIMNGIYAVYAYEYGRWFRGKLCNLTSKDKGTGGIGVFLIDHGLRVNVSCECIFPIRAIFTQLPGQAARASLDVPNIENIKWSDDEIRQFKADIEKKKFNAMVKIVGFDEYLHMTIVKVILLEIVNGEERPYTFGGRLTPALHVGEE